MAEHRESKGVVDSICVDCKYIYECSIKANTEERGNHVTECSKFKEDNHNEQKQFILIDDLYPNEILLNKHKQFGLWLIRAPEDAGIVNLIYQGSVVASFPVSTAKVAEIRETADKVLYIRSEQDDTTK